MRWRGRRACGRRGCPSRWRCWRGEACSRTGETGRGGCERPKKTHAAPADRADGSARVGHRPPNPARPPGIPFFTINFLAGLKSIPQDAYEAAEVDGAGAWSRFIHVTVPGMEYVLIAPPMIAAWLRGVAPSAWARLVADFVTRIRRSTAGRG
ncbi:MAG: ABC transporter permease subunit [Candidatus Dormibacteraceae bacterium]